MCEQSQLRSPRVSGPGAVRGEVSAQLTGRRRTRWAHCHRSPPAPAPAHRTPTRAERQEPVARAAALWGPCTQERRAAEGRSVAPGGAELQSQLCHSLTDGKALGSFPAFLGHFPHLQNAETLPPPVWLEGPTDNT